MSSEEWMWWQDVPEERAEEIIEKMAQYVMKHKLEEVIHFILMSASPLSRLGSEVGLAIFGPYMDYLGTAEYMAVYRKEGNMQRLLQRIDELKKKEKKRVEEEKERASKKESARSK